MLVETLLKSKCAATFTGPVNQSFFSHICVMLLFANQLQVQNDNINELSSSFLLENKFKD